MTKSWKVLKHSDHFLHWQKKGNWNFANTYTDTRYAIISYAISYASNLSDEIDNIDGQYGAHTTFLNLLYCTMSLNYPHFSEGYCVSKTLWYLVSFHDIAIEQKKKNNKMVGHHAEYVPFLGM